MTLPLPTVSVDSRSYVSITRTSSKKPVAGIGRGSCSSTDGRETLRKRARAKSLSVALARRLIQAGDGTLSKQYLDTCTCSGALISRGGRWQSRYCRHRWCFVCNRIRTARLIQSYGNLVESATDPYMVTLSFANVLPEALPDALDDMGRIFNSCKQGVRYRGFSLNGVRSLEVTVNRQNGTVHPHFHILIEGKETADLFHSLWLDRCIKNGRKVSKKGQDVRPANSNSLKELFKYCTKGLPRLKDSKQNTSYFSVLDLVFQGLKGRRLVQPFGSWYNSETAQDLDGEDAFDDLESGIPTDQPEGTVAVWIDDLQGWVIDRTGEMAGEFTPSDKWQRYIESIQGYA